MTGPRIHCVILNWRTPDMTLRALDAAQAAMDGLPGGITVVDNDSGDGSEDRLRATIADMPRVRVVQSGRNGGFGAGNNHAIRAGLPDGPADLIYILNSDAFPDARAIHALRDHLAAHPAAGLAGSLIVGEDGVPHLTTFRFPSIASEFEGAARFGPISRLLRHRAVPVPTPDHARPVDWLAGASLMVRADVLSEIGLFDEGFFLYFEETDLCRRAAAAGWETHFVPDSRVVHVGSASTGMKEWAETPDYWFASRRRYFTKARGPVHAGLATLAHIAGGAIHRARCALTGRRPADPPRFLRRLIAQEWGPAPRAPHHTESPPA